MTTAVQFVRGGDLTLWGVGSLLAAMAADAHATKERGRVDATDKASLADVAAAARGDGEAYARIIARYQNTIAQRMARFTRDPATADELVHDVFVEAYFSLPQYRGDAPLEHWLTRIATRVGYGFWKRQRSVRTVTYQDQVHGSQQLAGVAGGDEPADEVAALLERLPPRDRLVLTLLYLESRSTAEAAELAGWSQTMVKVQAYRARQKLRKMLQESEAVDTKREVTDG